MGPGLSVRNKIRKNEWMDGKRTERKEPTGKIEWSFKNGHGDMGMQEKENGKSWETIWECTREHMVEPVETRQKRTDARGKHLERMKERTRQGATNKLRTQR